MPELRTKTSVGEETVNETVTRAQRLLKPLSPEVNANDLINPPVAPGLTPPKMGQLPNSPLVKNVATESQNIISAQTEEAARLKALREENAMLFNEGSLSDLYTQKQDEYGIPDTLKELKDISLQLADATTASELTKTKIAGADGQTTGQAQREITQEDRESAVRNSGLAARAAVLQGNLETASALASEAVNIAYQDRTLKQNNLINQINDLSGTVDKQTQQLLDQAKAEAEAELRQIEEVKSAIASSLVNGATQVEIAKLTDPNIDDATKLSLAQSITGRGSGQMRDLDIQQAKSNLMTDEAQRANIYDQIRSRQVALREAETTATTEQEKLLAKQTADAEQALSIKALAEDIKDLSGLGAAVGVGFKKSIIGSLPFVSGDAVSGSKRADFEAQATRLANLLTLDNLDLMSGVLSETDIKILETAGSNLRNFDQSEAAYKAEVDRIISTMDRTISNNGVTPEQAVFYGLIDEQDAQTLDAIWNNL